MQRILGIALFVIGLVLLIFGISSTHTVKEKIFGNVTGHYSETTVWYIIGGVVLMIIGGGLAMLRRRR